MDQPSDEGLESNVEMWEEAERYLEYLCDHPDAQRGNNAVTVALADAYNRCIEERRRASDLLELRRKWSARPIGGVGK